MSRAKSPLDTSNGLKVPGVAARRGDDTAARVRRLVQERAEELSACPATCPTPLATGTSWRHLPFLFPRRTVRLATMFSGIGAVEHALQRLRLRHHIVFAGDIDEKCRQSYFANYDIRPSDWFSDATTFDATKYVGQVDLLVGGAPCQAFSMVGKRRGFEDARGTLFYDFARVIRETRPKVFIFENVKGLTNHDHGRTWQVMHISCVYYGK